MGLLLLKAVGPIEGTSIILTHASGNACTSFWIEELCYMNQILIGGLEGIDPLLGLD